MPNGFRTRYFSVEKAGPIFYECIKRRGEGVLAALFKSSFYVRFGQNFVCIGTSAMGMGPLNAASSATEKMDWQASGLQRGDPVYIYDGVIRVGHLLCLDTSYALCWQPPPPPEGWTRQTLSVGLANLDCLLRELEPQEGLVRLLPGALRRVIEPELDLAAIPYARLQQWLKKIMRGEGAVAEGGLAGVEYLLGLGPGLTPSGDDLIAGVLVVLNMLGKKQGVVQIRHMLDHHLDERTGPLSAAHLEMAALGMAAEAVHEALAALVCGTLSDQRETLASLSRIGHSSGWDVLVGMVTTLNAWLDAEPLNFSRSGTAAMPGNSWGRKDCTRWANPAIR